jgi:hypothetical protein
LIFVNLQFCFADQGAEMAEVETITTAEAAKLLGVTAEWVRRLARDGVIPKPEKNRVQLVAAVQGYIRWLKDDERRAARMSAQTRVQAARAKEIELRNVRTEAGLIEPAVVRQTFADIVNTIREEFAVVAAETSDLAVRSAVDGRINDAIERAERRFRKAMKALGAVAMNTRTRKVIHNGW